MEPPCEKPVIIEHYFATQHCFQILVYSLNTKQQEQKKKKRKKCCLKLINLREASQRRETYCVELLQVVLPEADQ